jgi:hypothetical protein
MKVPEKGTIVKPVELQEHALSATAGKSKRRFVWPGQMELSDDPRPASKGQSSPCYVAHEFVIQYRRVGLRIIFEYVRHACLTLSFLHPSLYITHVMLAL